MGVTVSDETERRNRTPRLDAALTEKYHADPEGFVRRMRANLALGVFVLILAGLLAYFAIVVVKLTSGGDSLMLLALCTLFIVIAIFHDVKWKMALVRKESVPSAGASASKGG
jgi:hypothetical protein